MFFTDMQLEGFLWTAFILGTICFFGYKLVRAPFDAFGHKMSDGVGKSFVKTVVTLLAVVAVVSVLVNTPGFPLKYLLYYLFEGVARIGALVLLLLAIVAIGWYGFKRVIGKAGGGRPRY